MTQSSLLFIIGLSVPVLVACIKVILSALGRELNKLATRRLAIGLGVVIFAIFICSGAILNTNLHEGLDYINNQVGLDADIVDN